MALEIRFKKGKDEVVKTCQFIPARKYLEYLEIEESIDQGDEKPSEVLNKRLKFIVSLFDGLTVDDLYDGLSTKELPIVTQEVVMAILGGGDDDPKDK